MEELIWMIDMIIEVIVKIGLLGVIYKYLTKE